MGFGTFGAKNALELTHAPRFLVQRYLISCWCLVGWIMRVFLDASGDTTLFGAQVVALIWYLLFFYCLEKHTRIFIKVVKAC